MDGSCPTSIKQSNLVNICVHPEIFFFYFTSLLLKIQSLLTTFMYVVHTHNSDVPQPSVDVTKNAVTNYTMLQIVSPFMLCANLHLLSIMAGLSVL